MNFGRRAACAGLNNCVFVAALLLSGLLISAGPVQQPPVIDWFLYLPITPDNCQLPYCEPTNHAVFEVSFISSEVPVHVEKSLDLVNWFQVSHVPMSSTNGVRWYWGEYVNGPAGYYRLKVEN